MPAGNGHPNPIEDPSDSPGPPGCRCAEPPLVGDGRAQPPDPQCTVGRYHWGAWGGPLSALVSVECRGLASHESPLHAHTTSRFVRPMVRPPHSLSHSTHRRRRVAMHSVVRPSHSRLSRVHTHGTRDAHRLTHSPLGLALSLAHLLRRATLPLAAAVSCLVRRAPASSQAPVAQGLRPIRRGRALGLRPLAPVCQAAIHTPANPLGLLFPLSSVGRG